MFSSGQDVVFHMSCCFEEVDSAYMVFKDCYNWGRDGLGAKVGVAHRGQEYKDFWGGHRESRASGQVSLV